MKKIQHVTLPTDALNGLIHGYYHHSKSTDEFCKSLFYIDVTDRGASDALYAILKREPTKGIVPMGYGSLRDARGHTAPSHLAVVLSDNLLHMDSAKMSKGIQNIFRALAPTTYKNDTQITVYGESGVAKILNIVRDHEYKEYIDDPKSEVVLGGFDLESNMTVDHLVRMATEPKFEEAIINSPATEFKLGSNSVFMHPDALDKVVRMVRRCNKICIMHPDIHRYYFENVICKY